MKNVFTIFKKELIRFFTDKRIVFALFFPGILLFVIYNVLGGVMKDLMAGEDIEPGTQYQVYYNENESSQRPALVELGASYLFSTETDTTLTLQSYPSTDLEQMKEKVRDGEIHLVLYFSDHFDEWVNDPTKKGENCLSFFYDSNSTISSHLYTIFTSLVPTAYQNYSINQINGEYVNPDLATKDNMLLQIVSFIFPFITITFLFSTAVSICPESIAGEKERGTLSSILLTPVKRHEIVLGKILALSLTSLLSGIVSSLGVLFSLPNLMGLSIKDLFPNVGSIFLLLLVLLSLLFVFVSFATLVSTLCKSIKEASSFLSPLMGLFLVLTMIPLFADVSSLGFSFIPILNVTASMALIIQGVPIFTLSPYLAITITMNILLALGLVFLTGYLFRKEKVMITR